MEFGMEPDSQIITAVEVEPGSYMDGDNFEKLYEKTTDTGLKIDAFYGDKAYFRKSIIDSLEQKEIEVIVPVSQSVYRVDETKFNYNKDSDQWICERGCYSEEKVKKWVKRRSNWNYTYLFSKKDCKDCPHRQECCKGKNRRRFVVGEMTGKYYEYSQIAKTDEFKEKYKKRAKHENKNGELKRFHGLNRATGFRLFSVRIQARLGAIAVNLKRIARIANLINDIFSRYLNKLEPQEFFCSLRLKFQVISL